MSFEIKKRTVKLFVLFAVLLYILLFIGNTVASWLPISSGYEWVDAIIEWLIITLPVWFGIRKWGKKAVTEAV